MDETPHVVQRTIVIVPNQRCNLDQHLCIFAQLQFM